MGGCKSVVVGSRAVVVGSRVAVVGGNKAVEADDKAEAEGRGWLHKLKKSSFIVLGDLNTA